MPTYILFVFKKRSQLDRRIEFGVVFTNERNVMQCNATWRTRTLINTSPFFWFGVGGLSCSHNRRTSRASSPNRVYATYMSRPLTIIPFLFFVSLLLLVLWGAAARIREDDARIGGVAEYVMTLTETIRCKKDTVPINRRTKTSRKGRDSNLFNGLARIFGKVCAMRSWWQSKLA